MRLLWKILVITCLLSPLAHAAEKQVDEVRRSVLSTMLGKQESPLILNPYDTNYIVYTYGGSSIIRKNHRHSVKRIMSHKFFWRKTVIGRWI
ncbi:hypothetical protein AB204_17275 [Xenorhabdus khoisanae]|uniref:Uncharacterized protein n=1 Tax=Xenorhabdus khoisanae TaxID=880157 RepID=A0A0J5FNP8_9GAMM|nr:hypothetical protein AB204_17275 [Xenorhabdus khoisanae]